MNLKEIEFNPVGTKRNKGKAVLPNQGFSVT